MLSEAAHPSARFEPDVRRVRTKARVVVGLFALSAGVYVIEMAVQGWLMGILTKRLSKDASGPRALYRQRRR